MAIGRAVAIPEFVLQKPDGTKFTRIEMETQLRETLRSRHYWRLKAHDYGLDKKLALSVKPITVLHWFLDELVRRQIITGDEIGVRPEMDTDDKEFKEFEQRLSAAIQSGQALMIKEGDGIDMDDMTRSMPPATPGQPGFPPPPPFQQGGAPAPGYAPPPGPAPAAAPAQFAPGPFQPPPQQPSFQPQSAPFQTPPQMAQGVPPQAPQFQSPPSAPMAPPPAAFPPQGTPPMGMPLQAPQGMQPPPPPPAPAGRRGRGKAAAEPNMAPPPPAGMAMPMGAPMPQMPGLASPAPSAPMPMAQTMPMLPTPTAAPVGAPAAAVDLKPLMDKMDELVKQNATLSKQLAEQSFRITLMDQVLSLLLRPVYGKQMPQSSEQLGLEATYKEIGLPLPPR